VGGRSAGPGCRDGPRDARGPARPARPGIPRGPRRLGLARRRIRPQPPRRPARDARTPRRRPRLLPPPPPPPPARRFGESETPAEAEARAEADRCAAELRAGRALFSQGPRPAARAVADAWAAPLPAPALARLAALLGRGGALQGESARRLGPLAGRMADVARGIMALALDDRAREAGGGAGVGGAWSGLAPVAGPPEGNPPPPAPRSPPRVRPAAAMGEAGGEAFSTPLGVPPASPDGDGAASPPGRAGAPSSPPRTRGDHATSPGWSDPDEPRAVVVRGLRALGLLRRSDADRLARLPRAPPALEAVVRAAGAVTGLSPTPPPPPRGPARHHPPAGATPGAESPGASPASPPALRGPQADHRAAFRDFAGLRAMLEGALSAPLPEGRLGRLAIAREDSGGLARDRAACVRACGEVLGLLVDALEGVWALNEESQPVACAAAVARCEARRRRATSPAPEPASDRAPGSPPRRASQRELAAGAGTGAAGAGGRPATAGGGVTKPHVDELRRMAVPPSEGAVAVAEAVCRLVGEPALRRARRLHRSPSPGRRSASPGPRSPGASGAAGRLGGPPRLAAPEDGSRVAPDWWATLGRAMAQPLRFLARLDAAAGADGGAGDAGYAADGDGARPAQREAVRARVERLAARGLLDEEELARASQAVVALARWARQTAGIPPDSPREERGAGAGGAAGSFDGDAEPIDRGFASPRYLKATALSAGRAEEGRASSASRATSPPWGATKASSGGRVDAAAFLAAERSRERTAAAPRSPTRPHRSTTPVASNASFMKPTAAAAARAEGNVERRAPGGGGEGVAAAAGTAQWGRPSSVAGSSVAGSPAKPRSRAPAPAGRTGASPPARTRPTSASPAFGSSAGTPRLAGPGRRPRPATAAASPLPPERAGRRAASPGASRLADVRTARDASPARSLGGRSTGLDSNASFASPTARSEARSRPLVPAAAAAARGRVKSVGGVLRDDVVAIRGLRAPDAAVRAAVTASAALLGLSPVARKTRGLQPSPSMSARERSDASGRPPPPDWWGPAVKAMADPDFFLTRLAACSAARCAARAKTGKRPPAASAEALAALRDAATAVVGLGDAAWGRAAVGSGGWAGLACAEGLARWAARARAGVAADGAEGGDDVVPATPRGGAATPRGTGPPTTTEVEEPADDDATSPRVGGGTGADRVAAGGDGGGGGVRVSTFSLGALAGGWSPPQAHGGGCEDAAAEEAPATPLSPSGVGGGVVPGPGRPVTPGADGVLETATPEVEERPEGEAS